MKEYLDKIKILFEIHKSVTENWENKSNWQRASNLLTKLYFKLENAGNHEISKISTNLYLTSLSVYFNILDTWLSEGRLEDWRDEFVIVKCDEYDKNYVFFFYIMLLKFYINI